MPSAALRFTSPLPRSRVSGHPGTSESWNDQSVSSASAVSGPVATVRPLSRPAKGSVSRNGRANSRSKSRASRSASRSTTNPESATLKAVTRPATVPPAYARRRESTPTSSTRLPCERTRTSPESTPVAGAPVKRRSMNGKSPSVAESARSRRSKSMVPRGQRTAPRALRSPDAGSCTRARRTSIESPITWSRPVRSTSRTAGSVLSNASRDTSMRIPRSRGEETCSAARCASRCSKRRTRSRPFGPPPAISSAESPGAGWRACSRSVTLPSVMRTFRSRMSAGGPCGPLSGPPRRSSSSMLSRPLGCCTMLITGRRRSNSNNTARPAAKSKGL